MSGTEKSSTGAGGFTAFLSETFARAPLAEKWLFAPNRRVGDQWVERVARGGTPVAGVRVTIIKSGLALPAADAVLTKTKTKLITDRLGEMLVETLRVEFFGAGGGYLGRAKQSFALSAGLYRTIRELRLAGMSAAAMKGGGFEVKGKGEELRELLRRYEQTLAERKLIDYAGVLEIAARNMKKNPALFPARAIAIVPEELYKDLSPRERALVDLIPAERRIIVPDGGDAAKPFGAGAVDFFSAVGEANEVREIFRRILENGTRLDDVELLHTDSSVYPSLVFEIASRYALCEDGLPPVTFAEGVSASYSRPGRALAAWVELATEDWPVKTLAAALQDGLLEIEGGFDAARHSLFGLARELRGLGVISGRERMLKRIIDEKKALARRRGEKRTGEEPDARKEASRRRRGEILDMLGATIVSLAETMPAPDAGAEAVLEAALKLMGAGGKQYVHNEGKLDNYARESLEQEIAETLACIIEAGAPEDFEALEWLRALPAATNVLGSRPMPGRLHVDSIHGGGHSGRKRTFIAGLDDTRFPGGAAQDPLLLDNEREQLSDRLRTSEWRLKRRRDKFHLTLARLEGRLTMSYPRLAVEDDREMFPAAPLVDAWRIVSGRRDGGMEEFMSSIPQASFAPDVPERALDVSEWWLGALCGNEAPGARRAVTECFGNLRGGETAEEKRDGAGFTEYDGFASEAGRDFDPFDPKAPSRAVMSAGKLETLGRCPLAYFFGHILKIQPPDEPEREPGVWLDAAAAGSLLHEVFEKFMREITGKGLLPEFDRDLGRMNQILADSAAAYAEEYPPPDAASHASRMREFEQTLRIFLRGEEEHCRTSRPLYMETRIGMEAEDQTPLHTAAPVEIALPGGGSVTARCVIDRVDETSAAPARYALWDYKTGGTSRFNRADPFRSGRVLQHALYLLIVNARLRKIAPDALAESFGFFFPGVRGRGERISWTADELNEGGAIIEKLCRSAAAGCFIHTDDVNDCAWCEFAMVCGDVDLAAARAAAKIENEDNAALKHFRELRANEQEK